MSRRGALRRRRAAGRLAAVVPLVLGLAIAAGAPPALAHPAPPTPPGAPPPEDSLIPPGEAAGYRSEVTAITPPIPGLEARVLGGQDTIEVTWGGAEPIVVEGTRGEPMMRITGAEVEVNERSPSAWLSSERFGRVELPPGVDPTAPPRWRSVAPGGPFSWYEHRAQWMESERPAAVGDGTRPVEIRDWSVPISVGGRPAVIEGTLRWVPPPATIRDEASEVSSPLISALVLIAAMTLGALIGVRLRPRLAAVRGAG